MWHSTLTLALLPMASSHLGEQRTKVLKLFVENGIRTFAPKLQLKLQGFLHITKTELFINPGNYFVLNKNYFISVLGFLSTYVLVLVQFKASEKPPV
ncbi:uncharacterized protein LOC110854626 [Folsomia candida]|nr:uncharacterized protein LOC110854626 [Folsomia candida]